MMSVIEKRQALEQIRAEANKLIVALREECDHPLYTARYDGNTGNWCEQDDSYWVDFDCPDCGWTKRTYSDDNQTGKFIYRGPHPRVVR